MLVNNEFTFKKNIVQAKHGPQLWTVSALYVYFASCVSFPFLEASIHQM